MILYEKWLHFHVLLSILFGASLFMLGFFPLSYTSHERANSKDLPDFIDDIPLNKSLYHHHATRSVLMVIDAMRTDFVQNQQNTSMKYLNKMINDSTACLLNINVEVPTVTMPRIKAMTTGTVPNFIDVVMNLGSSELHMDSLLHQMYDKGGKMVFCGDNTWVKMFPAMFHRQLENQDSLYVNDFHEGDKNITKKLSEELKRSDWELLILHFLGLDHIGHVEGPFSAKVPTKLREMDTVAMHIHLALMHSMQASNEKPLFIITGDHGMRDTGGHGGSSYAEVNVPLIFLGPSCSQSNETYNQIDIPVTLSVLLGLPIPASSIGTIIPNLLNGISEEQKLFAYYYNGERLLRKLIALEGATAIDGEDFYFEFLEAKRAHKIFLQLNGDDSETASKKSTLFVNAEQSYRAAAKVMSQKLADSYVNFDLFSIITGLICLSSALLCMALTFISTCERICISSLFAVIFCLLACLFQYYLYGQSILQSNVLVLLLPALAYIFIATNIQIVAKLCRNIEVFRTLKSLPSTTKFHKFLVFGLVFHGISTASSSFIEEEHQIWYYLNNTLWVCLYLMETRHLINAKRTNNPKSNQTLENYSFIENQLRWVLLFIGHLIARRLNQTGDKWLNIPDIGDWLQMEENRTWNSLFVSVSLLLLYLACMDFGSILTNVLTITACMLIYYYRTLNGSVYFAGIKATDSTGTCVTLFWLNIAEIVAINFVPVLYNAIRSNLNRFDIKIIFGTLVVLVALIVALTHKPHNIFLIPLLLFSCNRVKHTSLFLNEKNARTNLNPFSQCVLYLWIGKQFFFYQGNSNSLASIDLNAGYIGLSNFNFMAVGFFLTINTFSGPILAFITFIHNTYDCNDQSLQQIDAKKSLPLVILLIAFPFTLYVFIILFLRQHIFIWSVFSPKLLYDFYYLCLMYLIWMIVRLILYLE